MNRSSHPCGICVFFGLRRHARPEVARDGRFAEKGRMVKPLATS
jgi:hypothetical protein